MANREHFNLYDRVLIQFEIDHNPRSTLSTSAKKVGCNRSSIYREILINSSVKLGKLEYFVHDKEHICCTIQKHFPYVCNSCSKQNCTKRKRYYDAYEADIYSKEDLHENRLVPRLTTSKLHALDDKVSSRVLNGQSLYHILSTDKSILCSESSLRRYINRGYLSCRAIDLPRTVRFASKKVYDYHRKRVDVALLKGRMYQDFVRLIRNEHHVVIEIDTVFGKKTDNNCILTFYERVSKFQWGQLIKQTSAATNGSITSLITSLKQACNNELFFDVMLMDNGVEFQEVPRLEFNENGVLNFRAFYCDPYRSGQKGGCERNHEFIRYMYKKGESIASLTQDKLDNLFSQINSLKRRSLGGCSSYELFVKTYNYIIAEILHIREIKPKEITFKKKK